MPTPESDRYYSTATDAWSYFLSQWFAAIQTATDDVLIDQADDSTEYWRLKLIRYVSAVESAIEWLHIVDAPASSEVSLAYWLRGARAFGSVPPCPAELNGRDIVELWGNQVPPSLTQIVWQLGGLEYVTSADDFQEWLNDRYTTKTAVTVWRRNGAYVTVSTSLTYDTTGDASELVDYVTPSALPVSLAPPGPPVDLGSLVRAVQDIAAREAQVSIDNGGAIYTVYGREILEEP